MGAPLKKSFLKKVTRTKVAGMYPKLKSRNPAPQVFMGAQGTEKTSKIFKPFAHTHESFFFDAIKCPRLPATGST